MSDLQRLSPDSCFREAMYRAFLLGMMLYAFCLQGKCEKRVQDVIERFWDFIDQLSINTFGR